MKETAMSDEKSAKTCKFDDIKKELIEFLRENLSIKINEDSEPGSGQIDVAVYLEGERIAYSWANI